MSQTERPASEKTVSKKPQRAWLSYVFTLFSGVLYAIALKYFVLPSKVVLTGTEGIAAALSYYFESQTLFITLYSCFQFVLVVFAFFAISKAFAFRSLLVVATVASLLAILPAFQVADPEPQNERIILVIFGGLIAGVAKALAFRNRGSTGDEDILGAYFAMKYLKPVGFIAILAATVSTAFGLVLDFLKNGDFQTVINTLMYTCIYIFVSAETLNNLYKKFKLTMLTLVAKDYQSPGQVIETTFPHRTYTYRKVAGGRSQSDYWLVQTLVTHEELPEILDALQKQNPDYFYYYQDIEGISQRYYISPI